MKTKRITLLILALVLVASLGLTLVACSNATVQDQLKNVWRNYEKYTYEVDTDGDGTVDGDYSVEIVMHKAKTDIAFGEDATLSDRKEGFLVTGNLAVGGYTMTTQCFFEISGASGFLSPTNTYSKTVYENGTVVLNAEFDGSNYRYHLSDNGSVTEGSFEMTAPYYDNAEFHQVLRGATLSDSFSFSFNVPIAAPGEVTAVSLSAVISGTEQVAWTDKNDGDAVKATECFKTTLTRSTKVEGAAQELYYSKDNFTVNGWELPHVLVKIVENGVTYTLTGASITR
jgi:hypothetical protein